MKVFLEEFLKKSSKELQCLGQIFIRGVTDRDKESGGYTVNFLEFFKGILGIIFERICGVIYEEINRKCDEETIWDLLVEVLERILEMKQTFGVMVARDFYLDYSASNSTPIKPARREIPLNNCQKNSLNNNNNLIS